MQYDVIVIGAGAAGLLAAARLGERGLNCVLLEKNRKPGVKILMSGGTRCNLTHATNAQGIVKAFGKQQGRFLHSALAALSPQQVVELFEAEGVATKIEPTGKIFPASDRAIDVLDALLARLRRSGTPLSLEEPAASITLTPTGAFEVVTALRSITAENLLLTTGGKSYPGCGTTGDGYAWAAALGHTIVPTRPALVPVTTSAGWVSQLQGVTIPDVNVSVVEAGEGKKKPLAERRSSFLLTHFGLSGPAVLDVSRAITGHATPQSLQLVCDFLPDEKLDPLAERLSKHLQSQGAKQLSNLHLEEVPIRLWLALLEQAGIPPDRRAAELDKASKRRLLEQLKGARIPVAGTRGFAKAEVTAGGVALVEVDSSTMQSKIVPGLYFAGEILDLDGPIGGFNFQAAFSTGWLAAERIADRFTAKRNAN